MELKNVEIKQIGELKTFDSGFSCVDFVVKTNEEYPQTLKLQANKEKADNLIKYNKVGDTVDISINLRGREWTNPKGETVVFNTIEAWKVFKSDDNKNAVQLAANAIDKIMPPESLNAEDNNDLPF